MINRAKLINYLHAKVHLLFSDGDEAEAILLSVDLEAPFSKSEFKFKVTKIFNEEISIPNCTDVGAVVVAKLSDLTFWEALE